MGHIILQTAGVLAALLIGALFGHSWKSGLLAEAWDRLEREERRLQEWMKQVEELAATLKEQRAGLDALYQEVLKRGQGSAALPNCLFPFAALETMSVSEMEAELASLQTAGTHGLRQWSLGDEIAKRKAEEKVARKKAVRWPGEF